MAVRFKRMVHNLITTRSTAYIMHQTCDRKKAYKTLEDGWDAVHHIKNNGNDKFPGFELRPYECPYCGKIHVGHSNRPRSTEEQLRILREGTDDESNRGN